MYFSVTLFSQGGQEDMDTLSKLSFILLEYGLSQNEVDALLAQFLQEEAAEYILAMEACDIDRYDLLKSENVC